MKTSNSIHEIIEHNNLDIEQIMNVLYANKHFCHKLAELLFGIKILVKKKLEDFILR